MNLLTLSIRRPVFITCVFLFSIISGLMAFSKLNVDLFPDVTFPIVAVTTTYQGSGPKEIENLISKPIEEAVSGVSGIESVKSVSQDNISTVIIEFKLGTDLKYAQQQVRDKISEIDKKLPEDLDANPIITLIDPNEKAIAYVSLTANLGQTQIYDLAKQRIKPLLESINGVGKINIIGGTEREIHVLVNKNSLASKEISMMQLVSKLKQSGKNVPGGNLGTQDESLNIRTTGEFADVKEILDVPISFYQNEVLTRIRDVAKVEDSVKDETSRTYMNGVPSLVLEVYKSSDANTVKIVEQVKKTIAKTNKQFKGQIDGFEVKLAKDDSVRIKNNLYDVGESILIGLALTIVGVYLFLGNIRSTLITATALPNSLVCAFLLMYLGGFTINIMTLLAMSLSVGLLIDDAIVVRENIFRHIEMGKNPTTAAIEGTKEIFMAVLATSFVIIGVFLPIAFLQGVVGQFFKQFGFTVCFIMLVSLIDALTMAPMLSAKFAGNLHNEKHTFFGKIDAVMRKVSESIQTKMVNGYEKILKITIKHYVIAIVLILAFTFGGFFASKFVAKTFIKQPDNGEFMVSIEMTPGTSLSQTAEVATAADKMIRSMKEVSFTILTIGGETKAASDQASIFVKLTPKKQRELSTTKVRDKVREDMKAYKSIQSYGVTDSDNIGGSGAESKKNTGAFSLDVIGEDLNEVYEVVKILQSSLANHPDLQDLDISYRDGMPELKITPNRYLSAMRGVSITDIGNEIRASVEGVTAGTFKQNGYDYDIRVRLQQNQRDISKLFGSTFVPNINNKMIPLSSIATKSETIGPSSIHRSDRMRYIAVSASVNQSGKGGLKKAMTDAEGILKEQMKIHKGIQYKFGGQAERFEELGKNIMMAMLLAVCFMYLILASLYESFRQPFIIMLVLPLAIGGGFYALWIASKAMDLFAMIGLVMLIGVSAKNSILLVDCFNQLKSSGMERTKAIVEAGKLRIRPIVMTSIVLIAGMLPVAIGLNEASQQRTSMGTVIIGGLVSSTLLTLVFIPAVYMAIFKCEFLLIKFKCFVGGLLRKNKK